MDDSHAPPPQVIEALARGGLVLTANQRAARTLRHAYDRLQHARNFANWHPPAILAWDTWLASLWHRQLLEGHATALLLNGTQEHTLWRAVIEADRQATSASLRPVDSLAELAARAWIQIHAYRGRHRLQSAADSSDTRAFTRWAAEFDRRCIRANYLTQAQLPEALRAAITDATLKIPHPEILLIGFDTTTPAQTALLEALQSVRTEISELTHESPGAPSIAASSRWVEIEQPKPAPTSLSLIAATDEYHELTTCTHWLRTHLTANPTAHLAVIVPDLESTRPDLDRIFRHILAPELEDIAAPSNSGPFEFSLGIPLAHTPMVATALDLLHWSISALPLDRVSALLLSPHFAASTTIPEHLARAEFDASILRRQHFLQPQISLDALHTLASQTKSASTLPTLLQHLRTLRTLLSKKDLTTAERPHADWAATIHDILAASGWAASTTTSTEFQTLRRWESALDELATLDFDGRRVLFADALAALERIATQTLFAPESRNAPIQIMGPLEAAGSTFDALWFLRAGDLVWPATPAPNPLLPWLLQRELAMPGVDPATDTAHARRVTERIAASAPTVLFSYAQQTSDGHQRPSPTLATLPLEPHTAAEITATTPPPIPIHLEAAADTAPIPPPPDHALRGGAAILQSQAACGFRAFAEKRLLASALDARELGLDPRERGSIVHDVLDHFWAEIENQETLKHLSFAERDTQLSLSINHALARHTASLASPWNHAYIDTERRRLLQLLRPWLDYERDARPPFAVKSREETRKDVEIGPLRLDIRVDRIDLTLTDNQPDGGEIILDYKTGPARPADWLGERPDAPQLPLYAVVSDAPHLAAVAFASVRPGTAMEITGYESHKGVLPKPSRLKTENLAAQVEEWRTVLTALATDFHAGNASVSPKQYPSTCRYCQQRLLCRLNPATLDADVLEEFEDDAEAERAK